VLVGSVNASAPKATVRAFAYVVATGNSVAHWLNEPSTPSRERVMELIRQIASVVALPDHAEQVEPALERINELIQPYVWREKFTTKHGERLSRFAISASAPPVEDIELLSAKCVIELAQQGLATGIRRCRNCSEWFYTTALRKKVDCDDDCRIEWHKRDPGAKRRHAQSQKKYYHSLFPNAQYRKSKRRKRRKGA